MYTFKTNINHKFWENFYIKIEKAIKTENYFFVFP